MKHLKQNYFHNVQYTSYCLIIILKLKSFINILLTLYFVHFLVFTTHPYSDRGTILSFRVTVSPRLPQATGA